MFNIIHASNANVMTNYKEMKTLRVMTELEKVLFAARDAALSDFARSTHKGHKQSETRPKKS